MISLTSNVLSLNCPPLLFLDCETADLVDRDREEASDWAKRAELLALGGGRTVETVLCKWERVGVDW